MTTRASSIQNQNKPCVEVQVSNRARRSFQAVRPSKNASRRQMAGKDVEQVRGVVVMLEHKAKASFFDLRVRQQRPSWSF